ncbi:MAG TPA: DNA adenine methylase [Ktedonobacteraceae bacterium]|nr:DNA adenine methylase [Ktedonobacteraceae bacterium]
MTFKQVLKYPGSKWGMAWIVKHFPEHHTYVSPYFGSGADFFLKRPAGYEVINDRSGSVVNLFQVIREHGQDLAELIELTPWSRDEYYASYEKTGDAIEDARRFLVRCWQAHGTRMNTRTGWRNRGSANGGQTTSLWRQLPDRIIAVIDRLKDTEIENKPALELIGRFQDQTDCLIYADPPYPLETRNYRKMYEHEMNDEDHVALLKALIQHRGPVVLSSYPNSLYEEILQGWQCVTMPTVAEAGAMRTEVLWLNRKAAHRRDAHTERLPLFCEVQI